MPVHVFSRWETTVPGNECVFRTADETGSLH
jgi:hypothetical protein